MIGQVGLIGTTVSFCKLEAGVRVEQKLNRSCAQEACEARCKPSKMNRMPRLLQALTVCVIILARASAAADRGRHHAASPERAVHPER